jgi:hypothetical protein
MVPTIPAVQPWTFITKNNKVGFSFASEECCPNPGCVTKLSRAKECTVSVIKTLKAPEVTYSCVNVVLYFK